MSRIWKGLFNFFHRRGLDYTIPASIMFAYPTEHCFDREH